MSIHLSDKSKASVRHLNGRPKVTFHGIDRAIVLPIGTELTLCMVEKLYKALKQSYGTSKGY